jgi:hypothetical protein
MVAAMVRTRGTGAKRAPSAAAALQLLELMTAEILERKGSTARGLYEIGARLARVRDEELWRAGGFEGFEDYVERALDVSRHTAYKYVRVAHHFNAEIAQRYGIEKLYLGLRYMEASAADERPGDLLAARVRLHDSKGRFIAVPFHQASTRQIREAISEVEERQSRQRRVPTVFEVRARRLTEALPAPPRGVSKKRVRLRRTRDGRIVASFSSIPVDELELFLKAVRAHLVKG